MRDYLDGLDAAARPLPAGGRVLAALGPRMLELARDRAAGAHPYLVTAEHTARAREILGKGPLLAPEVGVVLDDRPGPARAVARDHLRYYFQLPDYIASWKRLGFDDADFVGSGSDRLVEALVVWGTEDRIRSRVRDVLAAGADHVALQVLSADHDSVPVEQWRRLAGIVL